ncbi:hypothetical protein I4U23_005251 [Adineta vaga]|nr:hypothetical protein I4U23_005251 [Adineta vaga]
MNNNKVLYFALVLTLLVTWCSARATMEDLEDADHSNELRGIAQELFKRLFTKRCTNHGARCSESHKCCGTTNANGVCSCSPGSKNCVCSYGGEYATDSGGTVSQRKRYEWKY